MLDDRHYMRRPSYRSRWSMTTVLLVTNVACFFIQSILEYYRIFPVRHYFALSLDGMANWRFYQLLTFQFLHGGMMHLLVNLLGLYFFGRAVEESLGARGFLKLYFLSGTVGGLLHLAMAFAFPAHFGGGVLGASAGVFGLIAAFATQSPNQPITLLLFFILPVTFPAKVLLMIEGAMALFGILTPGSSNIAHAAHLGGMLTGIGYIRWLARSRNAVVRWRPFRRTQRPQLVTTTPLKRSPWKQPVKTVEADLPPAEFISQEVDPILDKISAQGIQSLTDRERQILESARKKMARR